MSMIPGRVSTWYGNGVANGQTLTLPGILEGDVILTIVAWSAASGEPAGVAVSTFTASDGSITSASVTTENKRIRVEYLQAAES